MGNVGVVEVGVTRLDCTTQLIGLLPAMPFASVPVPVSPLGYQRHFHCTIVNRAACRAGNASAIAGSPDAALHLLLLTPRMLLPCCYCYC